MKIINYEKKEIIPLTYEENKFYKKQEACPIYQKEFCYDKNDENYTNKKRLKTTVITQENIEVLLIVNAT